LIDHNTVNGRLICLPYGIGVGALLYRTDLLREYGYHLHLELGTTCIAWLLAFKPENGRKESRSFGALSGRERHPRLTCNALEWQASEGGGTIIEDDGTISVNNPDAIRAWERAASWVGSISPGGVTAYKEWDSFKYLAVWERGIHAQLERLLSRQPVGSFHVKDKFNLTLLPSGRARHANAGGPTNYGVSRYARHPHEAALLVHYLCRRDVQLRRSPLTCDTPTITDLFNNPEAEKGNPCFAVVKEAFGKWECPPAFNRRRQQVPRGFPRLF